MFVSGADLHISTMLTSDPIVNGIVCIYACMYLIMNKILLKPTAAEMPSVNGFKAVMVR